MSVAGPVTVTALPAVDHAPGLERAFALIPEERSYTLPRIEGQVPAYVRGTYYLNGPARFSRAGLAYRHWLDGDGMVAALRFDDRGVHFANRFVRSAKWTAEEEAGRPLFRTFGTAFPEDRLLRGIALASPVNVSVYPFAGTLLAFGEQGLPWELDPETLETRGLYTFGGGLNEISPLAAHAKIDPETGELWCFGVSFAAAEARLNLYRFSKEGSLLARRRVPLSLPSSLHDFALAPRHAAFYLAPYRLDMGVLATGGTLEDALAWEPEKGSRLLAVSRDTGEAVAEVAAGERYSLHTVNAWEEGTHLVVDVLELDRPVYDQYRVLPEVFPDVSPGRPVRLVLDLESGTLVDRVEIAYAKAPDFPAVDPRRYGQRADDVWMLGISATGLPGRKFFDQLVKVDFRDPTAAEIWQAPPGRYLAGEPAFVPDPAHATAGSILVPLFDATAGETGATSFLLFDAFDLAAGPRAVLPLESPIHLAFHSIFAPG
ncbi:MAG TPA: carotenoid oxygenase family protein [Thermoanaerobaculia bacterium]|nr:carotenoid oxygenase family protein [Thermoanaerobaculia bacterium]